jgi:uncharacterized cofD-like protein
MFNKPLPKIVTVGGGTGTFVVLSGLRDYPVELYSIVSMMDSGGSTGKLRDQLGVLPPGDLRQALVALSESEDIWRKLFTYRFSSGDLSGHTFGNILISALEMITGSNQEAVEYAMRILQTRGKVIPVTGTSCVLCAKYEDGSVVEGESNIDELKKPNSKLSYVYLSPKVTMNIEAKRALERAEYIILGPGDLYTSILPNLIVEGMRETIESLNTKIVFIANLMTRTGQTDNFKLTDFIEEITKYIGAHKIDCVVVNKTPLDPELLEVYREVDNAIPVEDNVDGSNYKGTKVIRADLLSKAKFTQSASDKVHRSLIRHDPEKIARVIFNVIDNRAKL